MPFNMDFLTRNYAYDNGVVATAVEAVASGVITNVIDGDHDTSVSITRATGNARFKVDLGAARTLNRIWLKSNSSGTPAIALESSTDDITYAAVTLTQVFNSTSGANNYQYHSFSDLSRRYWRVNVTDQATAIFYELFLMEYKQTLVDDNAPLIYRLGFNDPKTINLILADGTATHGTVYGQGRMALEVDFTFLTKTMRDNLYTLYKNRVTDGLCILLNRQLSPEYIRQFVWNGTFPLEINEVTKHLNTPYYSGTLHFLEAF